MDYNGYFKDRSRNLIATGHYRETHMVLDSVTGPWATVNSTRTLMFGSNDYLGLSADRRIIEAGVQALERYGTGSGGSRLTTGSFSLHHELESRLARYKGTEACLLFNSGYTANLGTISAICSKDWTVFGDRFNHASIVDGILLSGARLSRYRHNSMEDLESRLDADENTMKLIVTDGVFSMDGDIAPLPQICQLARSYNALVMVDDAHGMGVLGADGMGSVSHFNLKDSVDLQMGTLSKGIPAVGGFISGSHTTVDYLRNHSRSFIYTTALPPHVAACAIRALEIIEAEPWRRSHLAELSLHLKTRLIQVGFDVADSQTPIIPVITGEAGITTRLAALLLEDGIFIPSIRPPTVPKGKGRLRITLTASHTQEDTEILMDRLTHHAGALGLIAR